MSCCEPSDGEMAVPDENQQKRLDRSSPEPLHRQLKRILQDQIESGEIPVNTKLPSERSLEDIYGVSRITVRQAIHAIVQEGHVQSQPGKGFYVTEHKAGYEFHLLKSFTDTAIEGGRVPGSRLIRQAFEPTDPKIALSLQLPHDAPVLYIKRVRTLDGDPVSIQEDWLPQRISPGLLEQDWTTENISLYHELRTRYGVDPVQGRTILGARIATRDERELLHLAPPAAVLTLNQIAFDGHGKPVNASKIVQDPARYSVTLQQGRGSL